MKPVNNEIDNWPMWGNIEHRLVRDNNIGTCVCTKAHDILLIRLLSERSATDILGSIDYVGQMMLSIIVVICRAAGSIWYHQRELCGERVFQF